MSSPLRIIVSGLVGQHPVGGVAFDYLQYVVGLAEMGHDVYYHEDTWSWAYDPVSRTATDDPTYSVSFLTSFFARFAPHLADRWHYVSDHTLHHGMTAETFGAVARSADLFLNVSGASMLPEALNDECTTVFVDTDPGYNQIVMVERPSWSENVDRWIAGVRAHDRHVTFAENIHAPDCGVPDTGLRWITTRSPVVLGLWRGIAEMTPASEAEAWSTVMTWNAFKGPLIYRGVEYGSKGREFERIIDLPARTTEPLCLALGGIDAPENVIRSHGWEVVNGPEATMTPTDYQSFVRASRGEISIAKEVYVSLRTGWFSCRTACYLAAGRPAVVQNTGFSAYLPTGEGVLTFDDVDGAADALELVKSAPSRHASAALDFAAEYLAAPGVLGALLDDLGSGSY